MKIVDFIKWKQKEGISPVGKWSTIKVDTCEVVESGSLYDHETHWDDKPKKREN
jgi:hypothetical protein